MNKELIVQLTIVAVVCLLIGILVGVSLERSQGFPKHVLTKSGHGMYHPVTGIFELIPVEECK